MIAKPLTHLTKSSTPFVFNQSCQDAFEELKLRLINSPILWHYDPNLESRIEIDASDGVVASVLS